MRPGNRRWKRPRPSPIGREIRRNRHVPSVAAPLVGILLIAGIGIGYLHKRLSAAKKPDPILSATGAAVLPFQKGAAATRAGVLTGFEALFKGGELRSENAKLRARLDIIERENSELKDAARQAKRLREQLDFVSKTRRPALSAEVISWLPSPIKHTITLASRPGAGIQKNAAVITPKGLVGRVVEAEPLRAQVLLLVDPDSSVHALVVRSGKIVGQGVVQGQGKDRYPALKFLRPEDTLQHNDRVITSGQGGIFPQGLVIGWIEDVKQDAAHFAKSATVKPATGQPGTLREVLVLR